MLKYDEILSNYKRLYGEKKYNIISTHISNSKHSKSLIHQSINKKVIPSGPDFVASIHSNLRYSFANAETILTASLILFEMWIDSFGLTNSYPDKNTLEEIEKEILEQSKSESFNSDFSILKNIQEPRKESSDLKKKTFPYFGRSIITDVMREIDFETGEEHTGKLTMGLFEFTENFISNNYDDEKGNIAYDKDELPGFKKSWNYLGFDGNNYLFRDEDGVKWYVNDEFLKFRDKEKEVEYKFEISNRSLDNIDYKKSNHSDINKTKNSHKDFTNISSPIANEIKNCITDGTFYRRSLEYGKFVVKFFPNGRFKSRLEKKDGSTAYNTSGQWSLVNESKIKRDFDPNPADLSHDYIVVKSCNHIIIGQTPYFKE